MKLNDHEDDDESIKQVEDYEANESIEPLFIF